jgi:hypothetical protein
MSTKARYEPQVGGVACRCAIEFRHQVARLERGKEAVVALHDRGDFFGEGCLTERMTHLAIFVRRRARRN